jgi:dihydropteroate synthase
LDSTPDHARAVDGTVSMLEITLEGAVRIVGIVNITEDSFSDGGLYLATEPALDHARQLAKEGADFLELGPASSNPEAVRVSARDQISRLRPMIKGLSGCSTPISIDSTDSDVLRFAIEAGVSMLNDIRGFSDPHLYAELADSQASLVVVHSLLELERAGRNDATPEQVLASIDRFFEMRLAELVRSGISEDRLIVDPGMGFFLGTNPNASIAVLRRIPELRARFGRPVFVSVSRKSFLRAITGRSIAQIGAATLAAELHAAREGADYIRTHDVAALQDALEVSKSLG